MYEELVTALRRFGDWSIMDFEDNLSYANQIAEEAADAIEELLKAAKAMHTWIFLNTGDEQAAYDECGLTDEMNAMLGYGGQFAVKPPKEES